MQTCPLEDPACAKNILVSDAGEFARVVSRDPRTGAVWCWVADRSLERIVYLGVGVVEARYRMVPGAWTHMISLRSMGRGAPFTDHDGAAWRPSGGEALEVHVHTCASEKPRAYVRLSTPRIASSQP